MHFDSSTKKALGFSSRVLLFRSLDSVWYSIRLQFGGIVKLDYREQVKILSFQHLRQFRAVFCVKTRQTSYQEFISQQRVCFRQILRFFVVRNRHAMPFAKVVSGGNDANQVRIADTPQRSMMIFEYID